jgi:hypothetical protein
VIVFDHAAVARSDDDPDEDMTLPHIGGAG